MDRILVVWFLFSPEEDFCVELDAQEIQLTEQILKIRLSSNIYYENFSASASAFTCIRQSLYSRQFPNYTRKTGIISSGASLGHGHYLHQLLPQSS